MRNTKINLLIGFILLLLAVQVFGYDNLKTHPQLTEAAVTVYNNQTDQKLTKEQISWMKDGSIAEDTDPRYKNHYYNPVNGEGLSGWDKIAGITISVSGLPAKYWSKHQDSVSGNYSVDAILKLYKEENYKRAYQGVGHIVHLIQDMAVPAHTRNDSHAMGDLYEKWAEQYGAINLSKVDYININNIDQAFDELANYAHNNFYSKDTIDGNFKFTEIKNEKDLDGNKSKYGYNNNYKIIKIKENIWGNEYVYDFKVHLDYWNMLYPKAVGYSAGAIDYFAKEFEKIDEEKNKISFWDKVVAKLSKLFNDKEDDQRFFGDIFLAARNTIADGVMKLVGAADNTYDFSKLVYESGKEAAQDTVKKTIDTTIDIGGKVLSVAETVAESVGHPLTAEDLFKPKKATADEKNKIGANAPQSSCGRDCSGANSGTVGVKVKDNQDNSGAKGGEAQKINNTKNEPRPPIKDCNGVKGECSKANKVGVNAPQSSCGRDCGGTNFLFAGGSSIETDQEIKDIAAKAGAPAPQVKITGKPPLISSSTKADFQFFVSNENDFQCKLDSSEWQKCQEQISFNDLSQGTHSLKLLALNSAGDIASSSYDWLVDAAAPKAAIENLPSEFKESGFAINWNCDESENNPDAECGLKQSCGCFFDVQYKINNGEWISWINETENTSELFAAAAGKSDKIYFRVRAKDAAGNHGGWSETAETKIASPHIVISEIYFNEFNNGSEWIELYNPADNDFNIGNWTIDTKTYNADITLPANAVIIKNGYYLIGDAASNIWNPDKADWPAPDHIETMTLANSDGWLRLKNSIGEIVDSAGWKKNGTVDVCETAPINIADFTKGQSAERKAFATSTYELMQSNGAHELSGNSYDTDNNQNDFIIRLAPDPQNSQAPTEPREPLAAEAVDDLIVSHPFTGSNSVTLHWTAPKNANTRAGARYDLRYQIKSGECALNSEWENATTVASTTLPVPGSEGAAQEIRITGLEKETEYCFALKVFNGEARSNISNQAEEKILPEITACMRMPIDEWGAIKTDKLLFKNSPYCFNGYAFYIEQGQSLTVEPGVVIKLKEEGNIMVRGELIAIGRPDQPIVFTSYYDNEKGGKCSDAEHAASAGDWGKIAVGENGKLTMDNVIVNYGGKTNYFFALYQMHPDTVEEGVVYIDGGSAEIKNSRVSANLAGVDILFNSTVNISFSDIFNNQDDGVRAYGNNSTVNIANSNIFNNGAAGIRMYEDTESIINAGNSKIYGNQQGGVINDSLIGTTTAKNNWWGDNSGPYNAMSNPNGLGNAVEGNVSFDPWTRKE